MVCVTAIAFLALAGAASARVKVSISSGTLLIQPEDATAGKTRVIVEQFVDSTRSGVRVRQIGFGDPAIFSFDISDCQTNTVFNDVVCVPFPSRITINTLDLDDDVIVGGSNVGCEPTSGTPADVTLNGGNDTLRVATGCGGQASAAGINRLHPDLVADGGPGRDTISGGRLDDSLFGNEGTDTISGGAGDDHVNGDFLVGPHTPGDDQVRGGSGDDLLTGGRGSDLLDGGSGTDSVSYTEKNSGVNVTLDGTANDGEANEADNVIDVEHVIGSFGRDHLTGSAAAETLDGDPGDDELVGGLGADRLLGGDGNDLIDAREGVQDTVSCGRGSDVVIADLQDTVFARLAPGDPADAACESVQRFALDDGPPGHVVSNRVVIAADRSLRVRIACPHGARVACQGRVKLVDPRRSGHKLAAARYAVGLGRRASVRLHLSAAAARHVRRRGIVTAITRERGKSTIGPRSATSILRVGGSGR